VTDRPASRVLVLGNATVDMIQRVPALPRPGETVLATSLKRCAGGKGLNQAVACARTGTQVALVAPVGDDADAACLRAAIAGEPGLTTRWLVRAVPTDLSSIVVARDGENMIVSSAAAARSLAPDEAQAIAGGLEPGDILLLQGNLGALATLRAAMTGQARGARVILNTAPIDWDMAPVLAHVDVVIANQVEADTILGTQARDEEARVKALRACGPPVAIITLGAGGAIMATAGHLARVPAPQVEVVDTAGAGDVTVGTFVGLISRGVALEKALATAVAAASLSVTRPGTTPAFPTAAELQALLLHP
jgi:ribokinase